MMKASLARWPENAALIVRAVNSHAGLVETGRKRVGMRVKSRDGWEKPCAIVTFNTVEQAQAFDAALRAALQQAEAGE